jgi:glycerol-3-phosphate acyltransferase PlsY
MTLSFVGLLVFSYLLGSIPFSALITRWRTGLDLYEVGEGNVGARNVWHVVGPVWGVLASLLDGVKGATCYLVSTAIVHAPAPSVLLAGFAVALGHQFPLFWRGRGGKGLSTMAGFLVFFAPLPTLGGLAVLGLVYIFTRDFNPSIVVGSVAIIFFPLLFHQPTAMIEAMGFGILSGLKKLLDRPHEAQVWARHPWQGTAARPTLLVEDGEEEPSRHHQSS